MKKTLFGILLAACTLSGGAFAETHLMMDMKFKMPFALVDMTSRTSGLTTEFGKVTLGEASDDFRFKMESDRRVGVELNFKPHFMPQGGVSGFNLDTYFAWFKPMDNLTVTAGTSDERHWFKGNEERLVEKFGEISIIDCDADNELGVYYGLISNPLLKSSSEAFWRPWSHREGTVRWDRSYGWSSSQLGTKPDGQGTNLQLAYRQGETGWFATFVLVEHYWPDSSNENENEWINSRWISNASDSGNATKWIPEPQFRVGYGFRNGSLELVYKSPHFGNNVAAVFWQPRLLRDKLVGTIGATFANDVADGSSLFNGRKNQFNAFAFDARFQYKFSESLRAKVNLNYSLLAPGDINAYSDDNELALASPRYHYKDAKGNIVGNLPEQALYVIGSVGYTLPLGSVNFDAGLFMRDLDNNDGFALGENFLTLKGSWTWWILNGAGISVGGAWYHHLNTADYGKTIRTFTMDGIKDEFRLGAMVMVKLGI